MGRSDLSKHFGLRGRRGIGVGLARQAHDFGPALHQGVVLQRLGGALFAFGGAVEAVGEFAGDFGADAELGGERVEFRQELTRL
jgi:hypothetical protein